MNCGGQNVKVEKYNKLTAENGKKKKWPIQTRMHMLLELISSILMGLFSNQLKNGNESSPRILNQLKIFQKASHHTPDLM